MVTRILYDNEDYARIHSIKMIFEILLSDEEG